MPSVTVASLISRAKELSDNLDGAPGAGFISDTTWLQVANDAHRETELFLAQRGIVLRESEATLTATGATSYLLENLSSGPVSSECIGILAVYAVNGTDYSQLPPWHLVPSHRQYLAQTGEPFFWKISRSSANKHQISLHPTPASGTYKVFYVPRSTPLYSSLAGGEPSDAATTVNYPQGLENLVIAKMAEYASVKEGIPNPQLEKYHVKWQTVAEEYAQNLLLSEAPVVSRNSRRYRANVAGLQTANRDWYVWL